MCRQRNPAATAGFGELGIMEWMFFAEDEGESSNAFKATLVVVDRMEQKREVMIRDHDCRERAGSGVEFCHNPRVWLQWSLDYTSLVLHVACGARAFQ
mmetsp:Transcript_25983/g.40648  ORF Transcript_25983/g.40648 Transcript_25983/m.40648 type:complete len:98 (-) Transcript_25983:1422-1715(-)